MLRFRRLFGLGVFGASLAVALPVLGQAAPAGGAPSAPAAGPAEAAAGPAPAAAEAAPAVPAPVEAAPAGSPPADAAATTPPAPAATGDAAAAPAPAAGAEAAPAPPPPPTFAEIDERAPPPAPPTPEPPASQPEHWNPEDLGEERHDGFMIRLAIGFGYATSSSDRLTYSGVGGPYSIAFGYSVIDNLALTADFFGAGMIGADVSIDDGKDFDSLIDARTSGIGLGATYYLMPINIYASAAFGIGWHAFDAPRGGAQVSDVGFGLNAMLGKEFWIGGQWGIGAAFQFLLVRTGDDYDGPLLGMGFGGLFSATYN